MVRLLEQPKPGLVVPFRVGTVRMSNKDVRHDPWKTAGRVGLRLASSLHEWPKG